MLSYSKMCFYLFMYLCCYVLIIFFVIKYAYFWIICIIFFRFVYLWQLNKLWKFQSLPTVLLVIVVDLLRYFYKGFVHRLEKNFRRRNALKPFFIKSFFYRSLPITFFVDIFTKESLKFWVLREMLLLLIPNKCPLFLNLKKWTKLRFKKCVNFFGCIFSSTVFQELAK